MHDWAYITGSPWSTRPGMQLEREADYIEARRRAGADKHPFTEGAKVRAVKHAYRSGVDLAGWVGTVLEVMSGGRVMVNFGWRLRPEILRVEEIAFAASDAPVGPPAHRER